MSAQSAEGVVRELFDRVHASDLSVVELFHEDAVRYGHDGRIQRGRAEIADFYASIFPSSHPQPEIEYLVHEPFVGALLTLPENEQGLRHVIDLFEVEDGAIRSLRILMPGGV